MRLWYFLIRGARPRGAPPVMGGRPAPASPTLSEAHDANVRLGQVHLLEAHQVMVGLQYYFARGVGPRGGRCELLEAHLCLVRLR